MALLEWMEKGCLPNAKIAQIFEICNRIFLSGKAYGCELLSLRIAAVHGPEADKAVRGA